MVRLFETVDARLGPIGALVNNAGILERQTRVEHIDACADRSHLRDQRQGRVPLRARSGAPDVDGARRHGRGDRQRVVARRAARRAGRVRGLCGVQGGARRADDRAGARGRGRRHPRQRRARRHHLHRHPRRRRRAGPRRSSGADPADAARRRARSRSRARFCGCCRRKRRTRPARSSTSAAGGDGYGRLRTQSARGSAQRTTRLA